LEPLAAGRDLVLTAGVLPQSFRTLSFYHEKLDGFANCKAAIQISMPDLQGPLDTAELLWGSEIYYAFYDGQELLERLLARVVDAMFAVSEQFRRYARDRLDPAANTQHGYVIPGRLMIRDDSAIMLSPDMYAEFVRSHDARLLRRVGEGAIHFCGNGQHLIETFLDIPDLAGVDLGQPELMDVPVIYSQCRERGVAVTNMRPSRDDLLCGKARADFPTGCVFVHLAQNLDAAAEVVRAYRS